MTEKSSILKSPSGRSFLLDFTYSDSASDKPLILFLHGFKGFKDWGHFPRVAREFAKNGFIFIRFNFSHNGTNLQQPMDFADLEAFGNNTYSLELDETLEVIDQIRNGEIDPDIAKAKIHLLGHSRGGGIALLAGCESENVSSIAAWAPIASTGDRLMAYNPEEWEKTGVVFIPNARTGQEMPLYYNLFKDWKENQDRLNISAAIKNCPKKILIVHGTEDESVNVEGSRTLAETSPRIRLETISGAGHTFGGGHPWQKKGLPDDTLKAIRYTASFFLDRG